MQPTLNLIDHLLARGTRLQRLGRPAEAQETLRRLASFGDLPPEVSEEAEVRLALLALRQRNYRRARRHLAAALRHQPDSARYHYLMATACCAEENGDLERACRHYERALELEPGQGRCLVDCGLLYLRLGRLEEGVDCLEQAAEAAGDQVEVIRKVVRGLCQAGRPDRAEALLRQCRFRRPRCPRVQRLLAHFQFQQARRNQEMKSLDRVEVEEPILLPFVRSDATSAPADAERTFRHDGAATLPGPRWPRLLDPTRSGMRREVGD